MEQDYTLLPPGRFRRLQYSRQLNNTNDLESDIPLTRQELINQSNIRYVILNRYNRLIDNQDYNQLSELENVPTGLLSRKLIDNSKVILNDNLELFCSICQNNINNTISRLLFCNHIFHINCIDVWFINKNTCPNCKKSLCFTPILN